MLRRRFKRKRGVFEDGVQEQSSVVVVGGGGIKGPVTLSDCGVSVHAPVWLRGRHYDNRRVAKKSWGETGQPSKPGGHQHSSEPMAQLDGRFLSETAGARCGSEAAGQQSSRVAQGLDRNNNSPLTSPFSRAKLSRSAVGPTQNRYVHFGACSGLACSTVVGKERKGKKKTRHFIL